MTGLRCDSQAVEKRTSSFVDLELNQPWFKLLAPFDGKGVQVCFVLEKWLLTLVCVMIMKYRRIAVRCSN